MCITAIVSKIKQVEIYFRKCLCGQSVYACYCLYGGHCLNVWLTLRNTLTGEKVQKITHYLLRGGITVLIPKREYKLATGKFTRSVS